MYQHQPLGYKIPRLFLFVFDLISNKTSAIIRLYRGLAESE